MKAFEIMQWLYSLTPKQIENTQDVIKAGDKNKEVEKIAVTMFATAKVIKQAHEWGADLLITHEPLYYNHCDEHSDEQVESEKRAFLNQTGITVYRYHDYSHYLLPDVICKGVLDKVNFNANVSYDGFDLARITLNQPTTGKNVAKLLKEKLNLKNLRICGDCDFETKNLSFVAGANGWGDLKNFDNYIFIMGEICEWACAEYVRDAVELGHKKALIILGHIGSEREGMNLTAKMLKEQYPSISVKYFETEEAFFPLEEN